MSRARLSVSVSSQAKLSGHFLSYLRFVQGSATAPSRQLQKPANPFPPAPFCAHTCLVQPVDFSCSSTGSWLRSSSAQHVCAVIAMRTCQVAISNRYRPKDLCRATDKPPTRFSCVFGTLSGFSWSLLSGLEIPYITALSACCGGVRKGPLCQMLPGNQKRRHWPHSRAHDFCRVALFPSYNEYGAFPELSDTCQSSAITT